MPTPDDVGEFIGKVKEFKPGILAFITPVDVFEKLFKPLFPLASRTCGKQDFTIGESEVWLAGNTIGKTKELEELEEVFDEIGKRVEALNNPG